eukprot:553155-Hanusia_phi.AAC.3
MARGLRTLNIDRSTPLHILICIGDCEKHLLQTETHPHMKRHSCRQRVENSKGEKTKSPKLADEVLKSLGFTLCRTLTHCDTLGLSRRCGNVK